MGVFRTFRLTVQERIILHLNDYSKYIEQIEVPFPLTQEGIADAIGVVRSAIPRATKKMILKNQIKEALAHVSGVTRRRKVYYLTTDGIIAAQNIKNKLLSMDMKVINSQNKTIECKVKEVASMIGCDISILDIIINLDPENTFNYQKYTQLDLKRSKVLTQPSVPEGTSVDGKPISDLKGKGKKHYIEKAQKISYFIGRKTELEKINRLLHNNECKIVLIYGIAGIGKTTLAVKLLELEKEYANYSLFWHRFHEWDTLRNLLTSISRFLEYFNREKLTKYLEANQNIDLNEVGELLENDLRGLNTLFFFDDFHKINKQILELFTLLREILERISGVKFLIFSRSFVRFYDRRDVIVKNLITELELSGLNENDSKELLKFRKVKLDNFKNIYEFTNGHPLSLELLEPSMDLHEQKNINKYLEEEVLSRLSLREKSLMKIASVFRYPVPADGLFIFQKAQYSRETLSILVRKSLIKESREGYEVHDLIHDFFYSYLTRQERISYHKMVGKFYMIWLKMINDILKKRISKDLIPKMLMTPSVSKGRSLTKIDIYSHEKGLESLLDQRGRGILEAQYHFLMANDFNRAAEVAIILGHVLLNLNYVESLLDNLEKIELDRVTDVYHMDLTILKADALNILGEMDQAKKLYKRSIGIAEKENNKTKLAELYRKLGWIEQKLNEFDTAIELLNKSLTLSKEIGDAKSISNAYGGLGDVYWKMKDYEKSNKFYNKSLESAEDIMDLPGKAKTYLTLGIQSAKRGQFEESIQYYERCLDILDKSKGMDGVDYTTFYENLGDHYLKSIFSYYIQSNGNRK